MAQDTYVAPSVRASSAAFSDLQAGGLQNILNLVAAANAAVANPTTAPTVAATGGGSTGGSLPAGTYYVAYSWVDGSGETLAKESAASFTISATNIPQVTIPALPTGACSANIYLTVAGGASLSESLYATGITGTTFNMSYAGSADPLAPKLPSSNTTGAASVTSKLHKGNIADGLDLEWRRVSQLVSQYTAGTAVSQHWTRADLLKFDYALLVWHETIKEILTLMAGQARSLHYKSTAVMAQPYCTFP